MQPMSGIYIHCVQVKVNQSVLVIFYKTLNDSDKSSYAISQVNLPQSNVNISHLNSVSTVYTVLQNRLDAFLRNVHVRCILG